MGNIKSKLNYLSDAKDSIKAALISRRINVLDTDSFRSYADKIAAINESVLSYTPVDYSSLTTVQEKLDYVSKTKQLIKDAIELNGVSIDDKTPFSEYAGKVSEIPVTSTSAYPIYEYLQLDKVVYNGGFMIDGITGNRKLTVEYKYSTESTYTSTSTSSTPTYLAVVRHPNVWSMYAAFCGRYIIYKYRYYPTTSYGSSWTLQTGTTKKLLDAGYDNWHVIKASPPEGTVTLDGNTVFTFTMSPYNNSPSSTAVHFLSCGSTATTYTTVNARVAYIKVWNDGVNLSAELYPSKNSEGNIGMVDILTDTFYPLADQTYASLSENIVG